MTHTMDGQRYVGFQSVRGVLTPGTLLCIVWFDGETDLWNADGMEGVAALRRYYAERYERESLTIDVAVVQGVAV